MTTFSLLAEFVGIGTATAALRAAAPGMRWLEPFLPSHVMHPLGWTLLSFVWEGLFIGLATAGVLALLRRRSANVRYLAGCAALLLMAAAPAVTFSRLYDPSRQAPLTRRERPEQPLPDPPATVDLQSPEITPLPLVEMPVSVAPRSTPWHVAARAWCEARLAWFVSGWLVGVLALTAWLLAGWVRVQRWRRRLVAPLSRQWKAVVAELAERLCVGRAVRAFESRLASVPMALGWLRPVILVPACALTGLTPEQLRALLAHELAHIRRHDYLVNLLQSVVEALLFYHPAVWWVSGRVRTEREHCCDDLAVQACGSSATYVGALASAAELARRAGDHA